MDWWMPFQFDFMRQALWMAAMIAVPTALLSCLLVLKGWALLGDAVAHGVFPGIVLAYLLGWPLAIGAFAAGMVCAVGAGYLNQNSRIKQDTTLGVVFSGMFALGLLLYVWIRSDVHLDHILFGDLLGVTPQTLWQSGVIAVLITLAIVVKWRELLLHAFDPIQARTLGLRTGLLHYGLLAAVTLAVVASLQAVGLVLSIALLIAPGAIAYLCVRTFARMLLVAVLVSVCCAVGGVYASFFIDSAPAPTIVLLLAATFLLTFAWSQWQVRRQRRVSAQLPH
ncbi:membrane protein [Lampropedia cohaerens]|uniref:Membrane protein n=1 Tax=Lampropedia cohaerens TaxID=1610491 RepID=A0A0U1PYV6_9BURK|nr:metal ABC transporter permease [Lampropedia cohaerens]KKW67657.1 membrane protein [Lampropedia cohaerens]